MPLHSTAKIACMFAQDKFLEGAKPKDSVVEKKVIYPLAEIELQNGESIGTRGILNDRFDDGISTLQIIGQAMSDFGPQSTLSVNKKTEELQDDRKQRSTTHEAWWQNFEKKATETAIRVNNAPEPEALLKQSPQTLQELRGFKQQSAEHYKNALNLIDNVEDAQITNLIHYRKQLNTVDEQKNYQGQIQLIAIEKKINSSRMVKEPITIDQETHKPG